MGQFKQGYYQPKNPNKCVLTEQSLDSKGNFYRSSWEKRAMMFFDIHPGIVKWSSEPFSIPYFNSVKNKVSNYYIDFFVETSNGKKFLVEVKPKKETIPPVYPKKKTPKGIANYNTAILTYTVNLAKWEAAKKFCEEKGLEFMILTEDNIFN